MCGHRFSALSRISWLRPKSLIAARSAHVPVWRSARIGSRRRTPRSHVRRGPRPGDAIDALSTRVVRGQHGDCGAVSANCARMLRSPHGDNGAGGSSPPRSEKRCRRRSRAPGAPVRNARASVLRSRRGERTNVSSVRSPAPPPRRQDVERRSRRTVVRSSQEILGRGAVDGQRFQLDTGRPDVLDLAQANACETAGK